jgi:catalase
MTLGGPDGRAISAREMLAALQQDVVDHRAGSRWAHTNGFGVRGHFTPSDVAARYCAAEHFRGGRVPVTVRFSNSSSEATRHDEWPDVRGMAVKFHLDGGAETDLIAVSVPAFLARTRAEFLAVAEADRPRPVRRQRPWQRLLSMLRLEQPLPDPPPGKTVSGDAGLLEYAGRHPEAQTAVVAAGTQQVPMSWARVKYHAIHTFVVVDPEGVRRHVRFAWQPVAGVCPVDRPLDQPPDFLSTELRRRLAVAPASFELKMTIGDEGDAFHDPTVVWPVTRRTVMMGSIDLERVVDDQDAVERLSFNPMRLVPGVVPSDDAILHARGEIYELGASERGAVGCPIHQGVAG